MALAFSVAGSRSLMADPFGCVQARIVANQTEIRLDLAHDADFRVPRNTSRTATRQPLTEQIANHHHGLCRRQLRLSHHQ